MKFRKDELEIENWHPDPRIQSILTHDFFLLLVFFRKPLVDKMGVVDGFTRVKEAPECQKY